MFTSAAASGESLSLVSKLRARFIKLAASVDKFLINVFDSAAFFVDPTADALALIIVARFGIPITQHGQVIILSRSRLL